MDREALMTAIYENTMAVRKGMAAYIHSNFGDTDISPAQLHLLFAIRQAQPVNAKQLAAKHNMTAGAVSQLIDGLLQHGMITRTASATDRRIYELVLSPKGQQCVADIETRRRQTMDMVMAKLTTEELEAWLHVQHKLLEVFNNQNERSDRG